MAAVRMSPTGPGIPLLATVSIGTLPQTFEDATPTTVALEAPASDPAVLDFAANTYSVPVGAGPRSYEISYSLTASMVAGDSLTVGVLVNDALVTETFQAIYAEGGNASASCRVLLSDEDTIKLNAEAIGGDATLVNASLQIVRLNN